MNKFDQPDTYKMKKQRRTPDTYDDFTNMKWWEIPGILLFLGSLWVIVHVVEWFRNPICRGLALSAFIGFIISVMLLLMTAYLWSV